MIKRNVLRRLEILEEYMIPAGEPTVLDVVFIDGQTKQETERFQVTLGGYRSTQVHRRGATAPRTLS